jgi:hypothetical protein
LLNGQIHKYFHSLFRIMRCRFPLFRLGIYSFVFQQKPLPQLASVFLPKNLFLSFTIVPGFIAIPS